MRNFEQRCHEEAMEKFGKKYSDLEDEQCEEISKIVREKLDKWQ